MTQQNQKKVGAMRTPHRRDISARQDLLGRELRQLFDDYSQEEMPAELQRLAERLQGAFANPAAEEAPAGRRPAEPASGQADDTLPADDASQAGTDAALPGAPGARATVNADRPASAMLDKAEER